MIVYKGIHKSFIYLALLYFVCIVLPGTMLGQIRVQSPDSIHYRRISTIAEQLEYNHKLSQRKLEYLATINQWQLKKKVNKTQYLLLKHIDHQNLPVYLTTFNINAARTINTDKIKSGGSLKLNLSGKGVYMGEWDQGIPMANHDYLKDRVILGEISDTTAHATHVAGTLVGKGINSNYDGMATEATLVAYDWENSEGEMLDEVLNGMILSNHSYGTAAGWLFNSEKDQWQWLGNPGFTEDYKFGYYGSLSQAFDYVAFNAPEHLIVVGAGNDRIDKGPAAGTTYLDVNDQPSTEARMPDGGEDGFDCIPSSSTAKNVLTVGAINDIPKGYTSSADVKMTNFSGWGPTDDGRIKPDIVANGNAIASPYYDISQPTVTNLVAQLSGTSFAAPSVTGSLALLQEYYNNSRGSFMNASTLKALVIHTAEESGPSEGPDYMYGWGLMNSAKAAQLISSSLEGTTSKIIESTLSEGASFQTSIYYAGEKNLEATLTWTDPPAKPLISNVLNNSSPRLINDLDIRIISTTTNQTYFPYILDPANPNNAAQKGDNTLDNVEKIYLNDIPAGEYIVQISHKGTLKDPTQQFSLIISGIDAAPTISDVDKAELIKIYNNTDGDNWNESWNLDAPVNTWTGVTLSSEGKVLSLQLSNNNLSGIFPSINLPDLTDLNCSGNNLEGMSAPTHTQILNSLSLFENQMDFNDLIPLVDKASSFEYVPQDSIGTRIYQTFTAGNDLRLSLQPIYQVDNAKYTWLKSGKIIASGASANLTIQNITPADSGIYYLEITHPALPALTIHHKPFIVSVVTPDCTIDSDLQWTDAKCNKNNGAINLNIQNNDIPISISWNTGDTTGLINQLAPGTYTAEISDANGCSITVSQEIKEIPIPQVSIDAVDGAACGKEDGIASIIITSGVPPYNIQWETGQKTRIANNLPPGNHTVTISDANECIAQTEVIIEEVDGPVIVEKNTVDAVCGQQNGEASIEVNQGTPPYIIKWEHGPNSAEVSNLSPGKYSFSISDQRGCTISDSVSINNKGAPVVEIVEQSLDACGKSNGMATLSVTGGIPPYKVTWPDGQTGFTGRGLPGGAHLVTISDSNACITLKEVIIDKRDSIELDLVAVSDATCNQNNGNAIINVEGGDGKLSINWSHGANGETVNGLVPGEYLAWATDSAGCSDTIVVNIENQGNKPIADFETIQEGLKVTFRNTSMHGSIFKWDFGNGMWSTLENPLIIFSSPGEYDIQLVAASESCGIDTAQYTIMVENNIATSISSLDEGSIYLYPIPTRDILYLNIDPTLTVTLLEVFDTVGKLTLQKRMYTTRTNNIDLPIRNISDGIYFLKVTTIQGEGYYKFYKN